MAFYVVYILEAHPSDLWQDPANARAGLAIPNPTREPERQHVAGMCVRDLALDIPALVDGIDDAVEAAYTGWPDRIYVIGRDGRVAYKSAAGPYGFHPNDMEAVLRELLPLR